VKGFKVFSVHARERAILPLIPSSSPAPGVAPGVYREGIRAFLQDQRDKQMRLTALKVSILKARFSVVLLKRS
jgi:hypothetical protein